MKVKGIQVKVLVVFVACRQTEKQAALGLLGAMLTDLQLDLINGKQETISSTARGRLITYRVVFQNSPHQLYLTRLISLHLSPPPLPTHPPPPTHSTPPISLLGTRDQDSTRNGVVYICTSSATRSRAGVAQPERIEIFLSRSLSLRNARRTGGEIVFVVVVGINIVSLEKNKIKVIQIIRISVVMTYSDT